MTGSDAAKFLQGVITATALTRKNQNPRQDPFYAGFLNATGRVLYDVFVYPDPKGNIVKGARSDAGGFLIEVDADQALDLCKYIKRYKLRADVQVWQLQHGEGMIWQAWGVTDISEPDVPSGIVYRDPRAPDLGYRIFQPGYEPPERLLDLGLAKEHDYTVRRYLSGVPEGQNEILKEVALPQESNMDFMGAIDWRKGCYIGQELTIRTKHRGVVRKRILPCVIYDEHAAPPETLHYEPEGTGTGGDGVTGVRAHEVPQSTSIGRCGKSGRTAGKWLAGAGNIGLGLCRIETMTGVQLPGETAAAPVQGDEQFKLEWAGDDSDTQTSVRVKAFVPDWIQAGLDGVKPPQE